MQVVHDEMKKHLREYVNKRIEEYTRAIDVLIRLRDREDIVEDYLKWCENRRNSSM